MSSSSFVECCVCLEMRLCLHFTPCRHECVCAACYVEMRVPAFADLEKLAPFVCPMCRTPVTSVAEWTVALGDACEQEHVVMPADLIIKTDVEEQLKFFTFMKTYLREKRKIPHMLLRQIICQFYAYQFRTLRRPLCITVEQCELLLQLAPKNVARYNQCGHIMRRMLVALCTQPWLVKRELGEQGICYHGNFGDQPTIMEAIQLLYWNHIALMKKHIGMPGEFE